MQPNTHFTALPASQDSHSWRAVRRTWLFPGVLAGILAIVTTLPYVLAYRPSQDGSRFVGIFAYKTDQNMYLAYIREAASGYVFFYNPFTTQPHAPAFFNLEWLLVGWFSALSRIPSDIAWQCARVILIFAFSYSAYWLCTFLFQTRGVQNLVFLLMMLGNGFGWLIYLPRIGRFMPFHGTSDLTAGFHPFYGMLLYPHCLAGEMLTVLGVCLFLNGERGEKPSSYALAGVCAFIAGVSRPYNMLLLWFTFALFLGVDIMRARTFSRPVSRALAFLPAVIILPYYFWIFHVHPVFRWWNLQSSAVPPFGDTTLIAGEGVAFVLFCAGVLQFCRSRERQPVHWLMMCWVLAAAALYHSYPLVRFAIQFHTSFAVPMIAVGTMHFETGISNWLKEGWRSRILECAVVFASLGSLALFARTVKSAGAHIYRIDAELLSGFDWLNQHTAPRDGVLAWPDLGNQVPRYTQDTAFCGQMYLTPKYAEKLEIVNRFFNSATTDEERRELARRYGFRYALVDVDRQREFYAATSMAEVFRNSRVRIYRVPDW